MADGNKGSAPGGGLKDFIRNFPFRKIRFLYPFLFIINIVFFSYVIHKLFFASYTWEGEDTEKKFLIYRGESFSEVSEDLKAKGIIGNELLLKIAAKLTGKEDEIIARKYIFKNGMSNYELLDLLTNPDLVQTIKFRVLEGHTLKRISKMAEDKLLISPEEFMKAASNINYIRELGLEGKISNLEGFLFPDTYTVSMSTDGDELISVMFKEFKERVLYNTSLMDTIKKDTMDILEVLTLASIVEAETSIDAEMPVVAGVYLNRIKKKMRLEADPTVQYALPDGPKQRLLFEDLRIESPYNTYRNYGLPPGPINSPGLEAIKSVINPAAHKYLFFVATGTGGHTFTENFEDHLKAAEEYRKNMREKAK